MMTNEGLTKALQDQEERLAALVDRVDRIDGLLGGTLTRLGDTVQAVQCPVHLTVHMIPWAEL